MDTRDPSDGISHDDYEAAVLAVYDAAQTSEDWLVLRSAKDQAGMQWLKACVIAHRHLKLGSTLNQAFGVAFQECNIVPSGVQ